MKVQSQSINYQPSADISSENYMDAMGAQYIPELHGLGKEKQRLTFQVQSHGIPGQTVPYHKYKGEGGLNDEDEDEDEYDEFGNLIKGRKRTNETNTGKPLWTWSNNGKLKLACSQPVVPVPIVQDILRRDKIILIPQVEVTDVVAPKIYNQHIDHDVPKIDVEVKNTCVEIPNVRYVEKEVIIPIITGYTHKFVPKWEIHEVPRPVVKYIGEQKIVEVDVPDIKYVDKIVEKEVVVDTVEKRVPKIIEIPKYVDEVQYVWKPIEKIVYVQKLVPKFDVNLDCPPPLIVPYPVQTVKHIPPVMVKKDTYIPGNTSYDFKAPQGSVRVPEEYVKYFSPRKQNVLKETCFPNLNCCNVSNVKKETDSSNQSFIEVSSKNTKNTKLSVLKSITSVISSEEKFDENGNGNGNGNENRNRNGNGNGNENNDNDENENENESNTDNVDNVDNVDNADDNDDDDDIDSYRDNNEPIISNGNDLSA